MPFASIRNIRELLSSGRRLLSVYVSFSNHPILKFIFDGCDHLIGNEVLPRAVSAVGNMAVMQEIY